jgi:hypothetical protein
MICSPSGVRVMDVVGVALDGAGGDHLVDAWADLVDGGLELGADLVLGHRAGVVQAEEAVGVGDGDVQVGSFDDSAVAFPDVLAARQLGDEAFDLGQRGAEGREAGGLAEVGRACRGA